MPSIHGVMFYTAVIKLKKNSFLYKLAYTEHLQS